MIRRSDQYGGDHDDNNNSDHDDNNMNFGDKNDDHDDNNYDVKACPVCRRPHSNGGRGDASNTRLPKNG